MPERWIAKHVVPPRVGAQAADVEAGATFRDWWAQIDRWMNEGGADERPAQSGAQERDSA
jgi:hypothetical protein